MYLKLLLLAGCVSSLQLFVPTISEAQPFRKASVKDLSGSRYLFSVKARYVDGYNPHTPPVGVTAEALLSISENGSVLGYKIPSIVPTPPPTPPATAGFVNGPEYFVRTTTGETLDPTSFLPSYEDSGSPNDLTPRLFAVSSTMNLLGYAENMWGPSEYFNHDVADEVAFHLKSPEWSAITNNARRLPFGPNGEIAFIDSASGAYHLTRWKGTATYRPLPSVANEPGLFRGLVPELQAGVSPDYAPQVQRVANDGAVLATVSFSVPGASATSYRVLRLNPDNTFAPYASENEYYHTDNSRGEVLIGLDNGTLAIKLGSTLRPISLTRPTGFSGCNYSGMNTSGEVVGQCVGTSQSGWFYWNSRGEAFSLAAIVEGFPTGQNALTAAPKILDNGSLVLHVGEPGLGQVFIATKNTPVVTRPTAVPADY